MRLLLRNIMKETFEANPETLQVHIIGFHMTSLKLKLSILMRFYLHDVLEQLKTNFHTNFRFKTVLGFVIEYA